MRNLDWDGQLNLRDLGGLSTPLAPSVKTMYGRVARGPRRELLTTAGWAAADLWGLRSIVDLRSSGEVGYQPTDPEVEQPRHLHVILAPTEDQTHPEFRDVCLPILDSPEYWHHNIGILPELIRGALEAIASSQTGILIHCAAGRDRTDMITALLLANAGVPSDEILDDYAESVRAIAGTSGYGAPTHDRQVGWGQDRVEQWIKEVEPHVRNFVADLDCHLARLGLDVRTRLTLRHLLVG